MDANTNAIPGQIESSSEPMMEPDANPTAKMLTDADMPDIDTLTADSEFSDFFSPGVSEALRKTALRKLFLSEVFNVRDGLDEYDGDYTQFEKLGEIVTSDMQHQLEMEARRKARQLLQNSDSRASGGTDTEAVSNCDDQPGLPSAPENGAASTAVQEDTSTSPNVIEHQDNVAGADADQRPKSPDENPARSVRAESEDACDDEISEDNNAV